MSVLGHELYQRTFYDKIPCILHVRDPTIRSRIKDLKDKLKLEI